MKTTKEKFIVLSHHERGKSVSGCSSIYALFLAPDAIYPNSDYIHTHESKKVFVEQLKEKTDNNSVLLFNGAYSLVTSENSFEALEYAIRKNIKVIVYWHETAWNLSFADRNKKKWDRLKELLVKDNISHWAASSHLKQLLMYIFKCSYEDVTVVYETMHFNGTPMAIRNNKPIRICGSGLTSDLRKGVDYFIEISKRLSSLDGKPCDFIWYWDTNKEQMKTHYSDIGAVQFPGFIPDLKTELIKNDIFLLTSRDDPAPLAALEALYCDLPVFSFNATGTMEMIPKEFVASSADEMMDNMISYCTNKEKYPPGFFRNIAKQYSPEKFLERATKKGLLLHSRFSQHLADSNKYEINSVAESLAENIDASKQLLYILNNKNISTKELMQITHIWKSCDPHAVNPINQSEENHQNMIFFNNILQWINEEASSVLSDKLLSAFKQIWHRRYKSSNSIVKETLEALKNIPAVKEIVIAGLGQNGKEILSFLREETLPCNTTISVWDDNIDSETINEMDIKQVYPEKWKKWPSSSIVVLSPLVYTGFEKKLEKLNINWNTNVINGSQNNDR